MVFVHPGTQIVSPIVCWVTSGFSTPGVRTGSATTGGASFRRSKRNPTARVARTIAPARRSRYVDTLRRYGWWIRARKTLIRTRPRHQRAAQSPHAVRDPGIADHVRLHRKREHSGECGCKAGCPDVVPSRAHEAGENREHPGDPERRAENAELDADLRVVRLAGLQRRVGARCRLADVAETVPLGMVHHRPGTLPEAHPVRVERGLVAARRAEVRGSPSTLRALIRQVDRGPVPRRADLREEVGPADGHCDDRTRSCNLDPTAADEGEHDETRRERDERRARERPEQSCCDGNREDDSGAAAKRGGRYEQCDDEEIAARERRQERRHEPAEERLVAADVVDEVLRQTVDRPDGLGAHTGAVVVVAEVTVEVVDDAVRPPPLHRDRVDVDEPETRDEGRDTEKEPRETA